MTFLLRVIKIQLPMKIHGEWFSRTAAFIQLCSYYSSMVQSSHQRGVRRDGDLYVLPSSIYELQQHFISRHGIQIHKYLNLKQSLLEKRSFLTNERLALNTYEGVVPLQFSWANSQFAKLLQPTLQTDYLCRNIQWLTWMCTELHSYVAGNSHCQ